jgi:hypothetical protein
VLPEGTRIRHKRHPELTGSIGNYEWNAPGVLSALPYLIRWDDSSRAYDVLGGFGIYAPATSVEPVDA